jgi:scopoletin glucosyltransferase
VSKKKIAMAADDGQQQPLHLLFFPFIAPGHLIPVADMAALFAFRGLKCTILTTPANAVVIRPAVDRANATFRGATDTPVIDISIVPFPDVGLPPGVESAVGLSSEADVLKLVEAIQRLREPFDRFLCAHRPDAVVADSFYAWASDAAAARSVPRLCFLGTSMLARACTDALVRTNPLQHAPEGPDSVVTLPGLPHRVALRRNQLMDPAKNKQEWECYELANAADQRSYGEVFNSFAELEPGCVEHYRAALGRRVWLLGPLAHASRDATARGDAEGLSPDGESCLRWLDEKPEGSVVYVSFGTLTYFTPAERRELARGLLLSGKNFVWVMSGAADTDCWMPEGFAERIAHGERSVIFRSWAPQKLILNHPAVGGFVTHCGWNSVLEALNAGVPMVTWPRYSDQFYNEKLIVEVLKVGVSLGATGYGSMWEVRDSVVSGETIAEAIGGVMGGDEVAEGLRRKARELGAKAKKATEEGGSSYEDVGQLIQELMTHRSSVRV